MSVREEDRQKTGCSKGGLGLAAIAAVGVGVGAAVYYYFNRRPENPDSTGATTSGWTCENTVPLSSHNNSLEETNSYTTISEHSTTDTSINNNMSGISSSNLNISISENDEEESENYSNVSEYEYTISEGEFVEYESDSTVSENESVELENDPTASEDESVESQHYSTVSENDSIRSENDASEFDSEDYTDYTSYTENDQESEDSSESDYMDSDGVSLTPYYLEFLTNHSTEGYGDNRRDTVYTSVQGAGDNLESDSETNMHWDVINYDPDLPSYQRSSTVGTLSLRSVLNAIQWQKKEDHTNRVRNRAFRERSWSLEECSICFDLMLRDQELMSLPCTHNFHQQCILPWLQERQTCPNCRKTA